MEQAAFANTKPSKMAVSISISNLILGEISLKYEYPILPFLVLTVPINFQSTNLLLLPPETAGFFRSFGFGLFPNLTGTTGIGVRLHNEGWYIEPLLELGYARIDYSLPTGTQHLMMVNPKLLVGYYTIFTSGLHLNVGVGLAGRFFLPSKITAPVGQPVGVLAIGYAW